MSTEIRYIGDYQDDYIYGTFDDKKVLVEIPPNSPLKVCTIQLTVTYNTKVWTHEFEIPFYKLNVEFPISHYVHSIITNAWEEPTVATNGVQLRSYDMAKVRVLVVNPDQGDSRGLEDVEFYMVTGMITPLPITDIEYGSRVLLNAAQTVFASSQAVLTYTFLSNALPGSVQINKPSGSSVINIVSGPNSYYLHTISIPMRNIIAPEVDLYGLKVFFTATSNIDLGNIYLMPTQVDHHLLAYQNIHSTLSVIEMTGSAEFSEQIRTAQDTYVNNNVDLMQETEFSESMPIEFSTGFIHDKAKYSMLRELIKSYHKYLIDGSKLIPLVNNGTQKLSPYTSRERIYAEKIKFKKATNDNFSNRII
jgi:hypothetical protein